MLLLLKIATCLLCVGSIWSAPKFQKDQRKKRNSLEDFAAVFKSKTGEGAVSKAVSLGTKRVEEAFDDATDNVRTEFNGVMTPGERTRLKTLRNLRCPNGTRVFNLSRVALKDAVDAAEDLAPLLTRRPRPRSPTLAQGSPELDEQDAESLHTSSEGLRFLPVVCWNSTKEKLEETLQNFTKPQIRRVFHAKLLSILADRVAGQVAQLLPDNTTQLLCDGLKRADTRDVATLARYFPCKDRLRQEACSDPAMAEALLQKEREQGMNKLTEQEWKDMLDKFGNCTPPDFIRHAPASQLNKRFADLFSKDTAVELMKNKDFKTVDGDFVKSFGAKMCNVSLSSILKVPTQSLKEGKSSLACMKREKDRTKRRKVADKILGTRDAAKCADYFVNVSPADEKCWKLMSSNDLSGLNFTALEPEAMEQLDCETVRDVKTKRQLAKLSSWNSEELETYPWILRCMEPGDLDDADVQKMGDFIAQGKLKRAGAKISPSVKRKVMKKAKENLLNGGGSLDASKLVKLGPVLGALTRADVDELTADTVNDALPQLKEQLKTMKRPALRGLIRKLRPDQLKNRLCGLEEVAQDVPADMLASITNLWDKLAASNDCKFKCRTKEQCATVYAQLKTEVANWTSEGRDFLDRVRDSGALCGMPLEDVTELQPDSAFMDIAGAFFNAECDNPATSRLFSDKLSLYMSFSAKRRMSAADVKLVGGSYFKHLSPDDLKDYSADEKLDIFQSIGEADLSDVDTQSIKAKADAAVSSFVGVTGDITEVAVLYLGNLLCGLDSSQVDRMTSDALTDALPRVGHCPDLSPLTLGSYRQKMKTTMNINYVNMDASDVIQGGVALLSDCENMNTIPDTAKSDAFGSLAKPAKGWRQKVEARKKRWRDTSSEDEKNQDKMQSDMRCGLRKLLEARERVRRQENRPQRKKRSAGSGPFTCDDIRLLDEEAVILSEQDIAGLSNTDFNNCADVLGSVEEWSQAQKEALASKAKQVWGPVSTWTSGDVLLTAGAIVQGLTPQELSTMTFSLQHLEALGQRKNWTQEQLGAMFSSWLSSDSSVSSGAAAITGSHLQQLGHVVCGASTTHIASIISQAYRNAASEVGDAEHCSAEQRKAWATLAVQTFGPVTSWTLPQTASVDKMLAGLKSQDLSQLSSTQLSVMDLDTFAAIPPAEFASLTVIQLEGLSTQHALMVTQDQLNNLNGPQRAALQNLGVTFVIDNNNSAAGPTAAVTLVAITIMAALFGTQV